MTRFITFSLLLTLIFGGFIACKKAPTKAKKPLIKELGINNTDFDFLEARGKLTYEDDEQRLKTTAIIRMAKDSVIWMSLRPALGIEALRVLVRPDSAFLLDRLHNKYMAYDMKGLSQKVNFDLDFGLLQAMLLGNTLPIGGEYGDVIRGEQTFLITQREEMFKIESHISRRNRKLLRLAVDDTVSSNRMEVEYRDFKELEAGRVLPHSSFGFVDYRQDGQAKRSSLEADIQRIRFPEEPLTFPFSVPEKYKK